MKKIIIYTDGSCLGNPGSGGWAAILKVEGTDARRELAGGFSKTTNNRMEIISVLEALKQLREPCEVSIFSDSQYVCNTISKGWIYGWHRHGWIKSDKQPVKNVDLWQKLLPLLSQHKVTFHWLRGHAGHQDNERCDKLARDFASKSSLPEDPGFSSTCL